MATHHAPTDATVWKIVKNVGDVVAEGEEIVILESMKMEVPVLAEQDGTVTKLHVEPNQAIAEDEPVADVE
ncbi:acyl-CoA carboxylase biotin carboxyl carrier protein subunit [Sediminivirga luteola]|uniref:Acetyl-CoA carboxylase biotin carboxyl carrier protein subunit n=1 Tax=Sediminivirga luteola TaxID=1774748 RepID=A0A8J2XM73_9MICO|nr:acetyl-CoA carboxylase biotin carboxyl carrier protein subunit [Sediminivirga luteola]GGA23788.1 acetyl-CoA carboxylase biotin carboxyl carrier protein subunit [Sediminivirga luteola]